MRTRGSPHPGLLPVLAVLISLVATPALASPGPLESQPFRHGPANQGEDNVPGFRRWLGAEAAFDEISCQGLGFGCSGFGTAATFNGAVGTRTTMLEYTGPAGPEPWPARTGNRLFMAAVPGGDLSTAMLTTLGSGDGPFLGGTVSFGFRIHWLSQVPVVIYRHTDPDPARAISVTLMPDGSLVATTGVGTILGVTTKKVQTYTWHTLALTYGPKSTIFRLWLDGGTPQFSRTIAEGGAGGDLSLGIVYPTSTKFAIAFDDYVESSKLDSPIVGARINYLLPYGMGGAGGWSKVVTEPASCIERAENWQLVSEDQFVEVPEEKIACDVSSYGITTTNPHVMDVYTMDGVPSRHSPSHKYARDLSLHPKPGESIIGVRSRVRADTSGPPVTLTVSLLEQGPPLVDALEFEGEFRMAWGATHQAAPSGFPWTPDALNNLLVRLDSGPDAEALRRVSDVRVDYVWVPK